MLYQQEEGQIENGHELPLSRAKDASGPISTALSGSKKVWPVKEAHLLTSQAAALAASGQAGCSRKAGVPTAGCPVPRGRIRITSLLCQQQALELSLLHPRQQPQLSTGVSVPHKNEPNSW